MPLFKVPLLLLSSVSFHLGLGRASSINADDTIMVTTTRERIWRYVGLPSDLFLKGTTWLATAAESTVIVYSFLDKPRPRDTLLHALGPTTASKLTVPFVLGASLVILGGYARIASFRTLGSYYTFVQCIRKEHKLITSGPYAVVRHPGYSGLLMCIVGWGLMHGTPGSWLQASGVLDFTWVRVPLGFSCVIMAASVVTVFRRSMDEDRYLSHRFGEEWQAWARRVRYQLIPFVY